WYANLSKDKTALLMAVRRELEIAYSMFSVALDQAVATRKHGRPALAKDHVAVSADLCVRFGTALEKVLQALGRHGRHFSSPPNITDLNSESFLGTRARQAVLKHNLYSRILFGLDNRFLHKIQTLAEIADDLTEEYLDTSAEMIEGAGSSKEQYWKQLTHL